MGCCFCLVWGLGVLLLLLFFLYGKQLYLQLTATIHCFRKDADRLVSLHSLQGSVYVFVCLGFLFVGFGVLFV